MIEITPHIFIHEDELTESFIRSSGPGGQNVNKVSTSVQLHFDAKGSPNIPAAVFERLKKIASHLMTLEGEIILTANKHRSQDRNRQDARERLIDLIRQATVVQKLRRPTKPSRSAKAKRVDQKKQRGATKKTRGRISRSDY